MLSDLKDPSILLLKNALEIGGQDLQSEMDQEEHLIKILSRKLEQIKPKIVMVEKDVTYKVMCMLRDQHNITVVSSMDEYKLSKIARFTQTITANGVTVIDKRFGMGKCSHFRVVNWTKHAREHGFGLESTKSSQGNGVV